MQLKIVGEKLQCENHTEPISPKYSIVKINSGMNCEAKLKMLINTPQFQCLFTHLDVHSPMLIFKRKRNHITITTYQKETGCFFKKFISSHHLYSKALNFQNYSLITYIMELPINGGCNK